MPDWLWIWAAQPSSEWSWLQIFNTGVAFGSFLATCVLACFTINLVKANNVMADSAQAQADAAMATLAENKINHLATALRQLEMIGLCVDSLYQIAKGKLPDRDDYYEKIAIEFANAIVEFKLYAPIWMRTSDDGAKFAVMGEHAKKMDSFFSEEYWMHGNVMRDRKVEIEKETTEFLKSLECIKKYVRHKIRSESALHPHRIRRSHSL